MNDFVAEDVHPTTEAERREAAIRFTGQQRFDAMTKDEQDAQFGPDVAAALRAGDVSLEDLIQRDGGFITTKPTQDLNFSS